MKLALVRYGEYENSHLNDKGRRTMILAAEKLKTIVKNTNACIISAKVARAFESAEVISKIINLSPVQTFSELYAAEEDGISANLKEAKKVIDTLFQKYNVIIAVTSREYIESLPNYLLALKNEVIHLDRGEVLIIDYEKMDLTKI